MSAAMIRTEDAWWTWHDADSERLSATIEEAETRCTAWVAGESDDGPVVMPGWYAADSSGCAVHYPNAQTGREAAEEYVEGADWGEVTRTQWHHVAAWREWEHSSERVLQEEHRIRLDPSEPPCEDGHTHEWRSADWGLRENPGVCGHGGGVIMEHACVHCGQRRTTDTWAQDPETGEQGLTSVVYEEVAS